MQFNEFKLSKELLEAIKRQGIEEPTEIQDKSIPLIMDGKDVIGESATGSGKTLAFGCGVIETSNPNGGIQSLILTPTRELAEQVKDSLLTINYKRLNIISVYGGVSIGPQINELKRADVVVGTPGRLLDHIERGTINLSRVKILVLDEADRMLDMGFVDDVEKIIRECPQKKQTLFFSATIAPEIKTLAKRYMDNPFKVVAKNMVDPSKLTQVYYDVQKNVKFSLLVHLLKKERSGLVMVFCNTRRNTDFVAKNLRANQIDAVAIHGGFTQNKRNSTLKSFNDSKAHVLVCTDVAARGLHIENVSHVFNYDIPKDSKDYVHRIGRTARAGDEGKAVNLLCDFDHDNYSRVRRDYREFKIDRIELPELEKVNIVKSESGGFRDNNSRESRRFGGGNRGSFRGNSRGGPRPSYGDGNRGSRFGRRPPARGGFNNRNNSHSNRSSSQSSY